jgi:hypothetical protein
MFLFLCGDQPCPESGKKTLQELLMRGLQRQSHSTQKIQDFMLGTGKKSSIFLFKESECLFFPKS